MKFFRLFLAILIYGISLSKPDLALAQEPLSLAKIESIILLTKFIDWSENLTFSVSKKKMYVVTDKNISLNCITELKKKANFNTWEIIYCNNLDEITKGSVVFLTKDQNGNAKKAIALSKKEDILTISDNMSDFCENGGMINIIDMGKQIQFEINYRIIQNKSLEINSKVLALAKIYD